MTDNEIIKALMCCSKMHDCRECVFWEMHSAQCVSELLSNTLDFIKRQKAEIERLKAEADMADGYADALEERAKSEAIKEFAKRLKEKASRGFWNELAYADVDDIDNLVKEMTEEDDNDA